MCKKNILFALSGLLAAGSLSSGCVSRTIKNNPVIPEGGDRSAALKKSPVVEKKVIWFWQDEFRNP